MTKQATIKMCVMCTSKHNQDAELNLPGVMNSVNLLVSSVEQIAEVKLLANLESTSAKEQLCDYLDDQIFHENDLFVFYFCGHGFLVGENTNSLLLSTSDTTDGNSQSEVGIKFEWILSKINASIGTVQNAKYIIVLDCCYSGIASNMGAAWIDTLDMKKYSGSVIITSTERPTECAKHIEIEGIKHAAFTYYFSRAFKKLLNSDHQFTLSNVIEETKQLITDSHLSQYIPLPKFKSVNGMESMVIFNKQNTSHSLTLNEDNKLKVLLVKTAIDFPIKNYDFGVPLGLWLLKSYMFIQGLDIHIHVFDERLSKLQNESLQFEDIVKNYDVVGVSMCTCEVPQALDKLRIAKESGAITFVGGIFTSTNEEYLFGQGCIDYVIPGVSTLPLYNLFKELNKIKMNNGVISNEKNESISYIAGVATKDNLHNSFSLWVPCQLPHIELTMWEEIARKYGVALNGKIDIFTARGCINKCAFCSVQKECGQKVLERDDESIIDEIDFLFHSGFRHFSIKDEDFFMYRSDRLLNIIRCVHKIHPEITFKIRARIDEMMDNHIVSLQELYDLGVREIQYGLETPDPVLLGKIKKGYKYKNSEVIEFIKKTVQTGIVANCSFILGIEGESNQYYDQLLAFFAKLESYKDMIKVYINFITPHPYNNNFSLEEYELVTTDLRYFTHKNPVAYPKGMVRITRKKMLSTYNTIVEKFDPNHRYNPVIPSDIKSAFVQGTALKKELPKHIGWK